MGALRTVGLLGIEFATVIGMFACALGLLFILRPGVDSIQRELTSVVAILEMRMIASALRLNSTIAAMPW